MPLSEIQITLTPEPPKRLKRSAYRTIEPSIRPVVRLLVENDFGSVPVWSCGGHLGGWLKSGELRRIARGRPFVVLAAKRTRDLFSTAMVLFCSRRGPMSFVRFVPHLTLRGRLLRAYPNAKVWCMVVFETRNAVKADLARPWHVYGGKRRSRACR